MWPFVDGFALFLAMMVVLQIVETAGHSGRGAYTLDVFPREERVRSLAYMRAALNVGFTVGALIGGVALAFNNDDIVRAVPLFTAAVLALNALYITRLPDAEHDRAPPPSDELLNPGALRNRGFVSLMTLDGVLGTNQVLLNIVIPLWLVEETDAPRVLLAWLFGTNTLLAVLLQVAAARGVNSVERSLRAARISASFFVLSCLIVLVTHDTLGLGDHRAGLARTRDGDRGRAVPVGRELGLPVGALRSRSPRRVPGRRPHRPHPRVGVGAGALHLPRHGVGYAGMAGHRRHRRRGHGRDAAVGPSRRALPAAGRGAGTRGGPCLNPPVASPAEWLAGARPRTLPAALAPVLAGTGVAAYVDGAVWWKAALALLVSLALQVGVNYANDYSDGVRGTDADRVGPMRLVGSGAAAPGAVKAAAFVAFGVAAVAGLVLAVTTAWWLVAVGLACIVAAWFYTGGTRPYGYAGLGEVMVFVFFGLVAVVGTTYVQTETFELAALCAAVGIGALACAILVANNLRDIPTDREAGKRTLAVRLGDGATRQLYVGLVLAAIVACVAVAALTTWWALLALAYAATASPAARAVLEGAAGPALVPVLQQTGVAELVFGAGLFVGLLIGQA